MNSVINPDIWFRHALINRLQSLLLLGFMAAFLALLGWILWGGDGIFWLLILAIVVVLQNPMLTPRLILRMYRASQLSPQQAPVLYDALGELARRNR